MARNSILKPRTSPTLLNLLVRLASTGTATAVELETNAIYMGRLQQEGLVKVADKVRSGGRGRPAHVYRCTDKGRKRAQRAQSKVTA